MKEEVAGDEVLEEATEHEKEDIIKLQSTIKEYEQLVFRKKEDDDKVIDSDSVPNQSNELNAETI